MNILKIIILLGILNPYLSAQTGDEWKKIEDNNKQIARSFYQDLWFSNKTENFEKYLANTYIVHDIGDRKGVIEEAIEQKRIADFFWKNGTLDCRMDFQIADGDLVASRWIAGFQPKTMVGKLLIGKKPLPIINVFRIQNDKIVEIWNHRHDIDTRRTLGFVAKGFLLGLLLVFGCLIWIYKLKKEINKINLTRMK